MKRALLAALWLLASAVHAAPLPVGSANVSYSVWTVSGASVLLKFMLPTAATRSLAGTDRPLLTTRRLGDYVLNQVGVRMAGRDCPAVDQGYDLGQVDPLAVGADLSGFEILFRCPGAGDLTLRDDVLFARAPDHINFARVERDGQAAQELFTATRRSLRVTASSALPAAGFASYARLGAMHLLQSTDRLCFLLGSLLLIRRKEEAGYAVAALLAGYLASLIASAPDLIVPRATLLEAFMGFMVALLAALITLRELRQSRVSIVGCSALLAVLALAAALTHFHRESLVLFGSALFAISLLRAARFAERAWLLTLAIVALLDGFALPSELAPMHVFHESQTWMTTAFNTGALLGATLIMGVPLALFALARRRITAAPRALMNEVAAACLGGLGTFWLLTRLYS